jgi:phosphate starvation-inducible PhoH-like protein
MKTITFDNMETARELFGRHNYNLARISDAVGVQINARGSTLNINGSDEGVVLAEKILIQLYGLIEEKISINFRLTPLSSTTNILFLP